MRSRAVKLIAVVGVTAAGLFLYPASGSASTPEIKGHVNSYIYYTYLYRHSYGDDTSGFQLNGCDNFYYSSIQNGRYHDETHGGWVSTDKAGPGWCGD